jgi:hypothetical protein
MTIIPDLEFGVALTGDLSLTFGWPGVTPANITLVKKLKGNFVNLSVWPGAKLVPASATDTKNLRSLVLELEAAGLTVLVVAHDDGQPSPEVRLQWYFDAPGFVARRKAILAALQGTKAIFEPFNEVSVTADDEKEFMPGQGKANALKFWNETAPEIFELVNAAGIPLSMPAWWDQSPDSWVEQGANVPLAVMKAARPACLAFHRYNWAGCLTPAESIEVIKTASAEVGAIPILSECNAMGMGPDNVIYGTLAEVGEWLAAYKAAGIGLCLWEMVSEPMVAYDVASPAYFAAVAAARGVEVAPPA